MIKLLPVAAWFTFSFIGKGNVTRTKEVNKIVHCTLETCCLLLIKRCEYCLDAFMHVTLLLKLRRFSPTSFSDTCKSRVLLEINNI